METEILEGTIKGFGGSWGSGLGILVFEEGPAVYCENPSTVRALDAAFPGFIAPGHAIDNDVIAGKRITYSVDFAGILGGFTPVEEF
jgi:hypothetical protein|tara:strand:+ start:85 stop:345 length:261 start_codon:yes stop_codon:yes gene_type:complete